jgi:hypothetical protein
VYHERSGVSTVYANALAASAPGFSQARYPNGSVILMEFAEAVIDGEGQVVRDAQGAPLKGAIAHIDVMRRGSGFGEAYGENRAGEWEFASYAPDGRTLQAPDKTAHCAGCHRNAGADKDFVFPHAALDHVAVVSLPVWQAGWPAPVASSVAVAAGTAPGRPTRR